MNRDPWEGVDRPLSIVIPFSTIMRKLKAYRRKRRFDRIKKSRAKLQRARAERDRPQE